MEYAQIENFAEQLEYKMRELKIDNKYQEEILEYCLTLESNIKEKEREKQKELEKIKALELEKQKEIEILENAHNIIMDTTTNQIAQQNIINTPCENENLILLKEPENNKESNNKLNDPIIIEEIKYDTPPFITEENEKTNSRRLLNLSKDFVRVFFTKTAKFFSTDKPSPITNGKKEPKSSYCLPLKCIPHKKRKSKRGNIMVFLFYISKIVFEWRE